MKMLVAALALASMIVVPTQIATAATAKSAWPPSLPKSYEVFFGGQKLGQDPDATVRLQLMRDAGSLQ
jgi:hypothetical protein